MVLVELNREKNLLHITVSQSFDKKSGEECLASVKSCIKDLKPGFMLLTDLRDVRSVDLSVTPYVKETMEIFNKNKVSKVVRILPEPAEDFGLNIMSIFHYDSKIPIVSCKTFEEACKHLSTQRVSS